MVAYNAWFGRTRRMTEDGLGGQGRGREERQREKCMILVTILIPTYQVRRMYSDGRQANHHKQIQDVGGVGLQEYA